MNSQTALARETCPNREEHVNGPKGYLAWAEWAEQISKTHDQFCCPGCGLWAIWRPKDRAHEIKTREAD